MQTAAGAAGLRALGVAAIMPHASECCC